MIVNLENVKIALKVKGIELEDEELLDMIDYYVNQIVSYTGVNLDVQTYHYSIINKKYLRRIVLPLSNIFDVDQIHINYELYDDDKYFVDAKNGVIFFKEPLSYCEHVHVKYLVKPDETIVANIISPLVADMIINDKENGDNGLDYGGEISSIHEGNVSISFKSSTSLNDSIKSRLDKLGNGEISLTGGKVKKGAYFL